MRRAPQVGFLPDGRRLHMQDGPIDLVVEAFGEPGNVGTAYRSAVKRLTGLLDSLCEELDALRRPADPLGTPLRGAIARRMHAAVAPYAANMFITPMAAVAGAVAESILAAMTDAADLDRAYVNNGGDIALHLEQGQSFTVGLADHPALGVTGIGLAGTAEIRAGQGVGGIATSGRHGRSFSFGIADAVTVLAPTAAAADAAATVIANAVDLPGHSGITRVAACDLQPDSDLGARRVTRHVVQLAANEVNAALGFGEDLARHLLARGLICGAVLRLQGVTRLVEIVPALSVDRSPATPGAAKLIESFVHA